ncbi:tail completion protein gp17 [Kushneria phosphatilytica]|uniref:DUF3168 domain-containing protein n=1 Tax=Kushneria phosphatilytica TaxID=657387 RepID=A0A1S1NX29_9GAMM|nr:hypothetical protein BH688_05565 [Kushneria phosphatilytica]QEL11314.1 DUF3168 domain-containing protein [Kushneria phosphatilytica]
MYPPVFKTCSGKSAVTAVLGTDPVRLFPTEAPQGVSTPYATHQIASGMPYNYLAQRPDTDRFTIQIDVFASDQGAAHEAADALIHAMEGAAYVTSYNLNERDEDTRNWRFSFDVDWIVPR